MSSTKSEQGGNDVGGIDLAQQDQRTKSRSTVQPPEQQPEQQLEQQPEQPTMKLAPETAVVYTPAQIAEPAQTAEPARTADKDDWCGHAYLKNGPYRPNRPGDERNRPACPYCHYNQSSKFDLPEVTGKIKKLEEQLSAIQVELKFFQAYRTMIEDAQLELADQCLDLKDKQELLDNQNAALPEEQREQRNFFEEAAQKVKQFNKGTGRALETTAPTAMDTSGTTAGVLGELHNFSTCAIDSPTSGKPLTHDETSYDWQLVPDTGDLLNQEAAANQERTQQAATNCYQPGQQSNAENKESIHQALINMQTDRNQKLTGDLGPILLKAAKQLLNEKHEDRPPNAFQKFVSNLVPENLGETLQQHEGAIDQLITQDGNRLARHDAKLAEHSQTHQEIFDALAKLQEENEYLRNQSISLQNQVNQLRG